MDFGIHPMGIIDWMNARFVYMCEIKNLLQFLKSWGLEDDRKRRAEAGWGVALVVVHTEVLVVAKERILLRLLYSKCHLGGAACILWGISRCLEVLSRPPWLLMYPLYATTSCMRICSHTRVYLGLKRVLQHAESETSPKPSTSLWSWLKSCHHSNPKYCFLHSLIATLTSGCARDICYIPFLVNVPFINSKESLVTLQCSVKVLSFKRHQLIPFETVTLTMETLVSFYHMVV